MKLSFTLKVFVAILGMILLIISGVVFFVNLKTQKIAEREVNRRLERARMSFENYRQEIEDKLLTVSYYISGNSAFLAYMGEAIENEDKESLLDQFEEIRGFSNCDFMIVADVEGFPIVDTSDSIAAIVGDRLLPFLEILEQEDRLPIGTLMADKLYNVVVSPIISGEFLLGYVFVGYAIDDQAAAKSGKITNCNILISGGDEPGQERLVASYFEEIDEELSKLELAKAYGGKSTEEIFEFSINKNKFKGLMGEIKAVDDRTVGHYLIAKSLKRELAPFREISTGLMLIGFLAVLIVSPLGILAARTVTQPVQHLVKAIEKVYDGQYDESQIQVRSQDEIGIMAKAFKGMVKELREQRELIEFMEQAQSSKVDLDPDRTATFSNTPMAPPTPSIIRSSILRVLETHEVLPPGFILNDRYQLAEVLGRGGMGVVYKAKDRSLDEVVALKMLHMDNAQLREMLKKETKLARKVTHRNILRIYDLVEIEGIPFISMEYVNGTTLKGLLQRVKKIPVHIGLRIAKQVCLGLGAAHEVGIVHGDIKPENVILNPRGEIKIMDFGVARVANLEASNDNQIAGTPAYMAPEQFQGLGADRRSDIYSLGIMMYELFAGSVPFSGNTLVEMFKLHLTSDLPPLEQFNSQIPPQMIHIIDVATRKKADKRFNSTREMLNLLNKVG